MLSPMRANGIRRVWHGWTTTDDADAYEALLLHEVVPGILRRQISGFRSIDVLRAPEPVDGLVEFATTMDFDGWDAVVAFAGGDGRGSVVPEAARRLLQRFDEHSQHYELRAGSGRRSGA